MFNFLKKEDNHYIKGYDKNEDSVYGEKYGDINEVFKYDTDDEDVDNNNKIDNYIYFNTFTNSSLIVSDEKDIELINIIKKDLGFEEIMELKEFTYDKYLVESLFKNKIFENREQFNNTVDTFNKINSNNDDIVMENKVKKYINDVYNISNDKQYKIKATVLMNELIEHIDPSNKIKINNIRNKLSKCMINAGLTKKRFTDGMYYYGLERKEHMKNSSYYKNDDNVNTRFATINYNRNEQVKVLYPNSREYCIEQFKRKNNKLQNKINNDINKLVRTTKGQMFLERRKKMATIDMINNKKREMEIELNN